MAVDLPPDNKIPNQQQRELLEMFVVQAGLALENAQRREQLSRQVRLGEALKKLALLSGHAGARSPRWRRRPTRSTRRSPSPQVTVRCFADNVEDHENHAAGTPHPARGSDGRWRWRCATTWCGTPPRACSASDLVLPARRRRSATSTSAPLIRSQLEQFGWTHGLLAPIGVDREVLGYVVVLRDDSHGALRRRTRSTRVHEAGRELGRLVRDVRLRRTERRLLAELRELDRYKGELIATISHELKTPLTSIIGHTELLEEAGVQPTSVSAISRNAARLDRLVTNLLNYSRIQGRRQLQRVPLDLVEAVPHVARDAADPGRSRRCRRSS